MAAKRLETRTLTRMEARSRFCGWLVKCGVLAFCVSVGFVVVATAIPQLREVRDLELKLAAAQARERAVTAKRDHRRIELRALREDPEYLEIHARDRLDYCREGERVLRFNRHR